MSEWINIEERLPEDETNVLVYTNYYNFEFTEIRVAQLSKQKRGTGIPKFWVGRDGSGAFSKPRKDRVTHWMPLPDSPNQ